MTQREEDARLREELERMEYEPLLHAEKVLILGSLVLGVLLLVVFVSFFRT